MNLVCAESFRRLMILRRRLTSRRQARYGIAFSLELLVRVRALDATSLGTILHKPDPDGHPAEKASRRKEVALGKNAVAARDGGRLNPCQEVRGVSPAMASRLHCLLRPKMR